MSVDPNAVNAVAQKRERLSREEKPIYPNTLFVRKDDAAETKARIDAAHMAEQARYGWPSNTTPSPSAPCEPLVDSGQLVGQALRQLYRDRLTYLRRLRADFQASVERCSRQIEELERLTELTLG